MAQVNLLREEVDLFDSREWREISHAQRREVAIQVMTRRGDQRSLQVADYLIKGHPQFSEISITESA